MEGITQFTKTGILTCIWYNLLAVFIHFEWGHSGGIAIFANCADMYGVPHVDQISVSDRLHGLPVSKKTCVKWPVASQMDNY